MGLQWAYKMWNMWSQQNVVYKMGSLSNLSIWPAQTNTIQHIQCIQHKYSGKNGCRKFSWSTNSQSTPSDAPAKMTLSFMWGGWTTTWCGHPFYFLHECTHLVVETAGDIKLIYGHLVKKQSTHINTLRTSSHRIFLQLASTIRQIHQIQSDISDPHLPLGTSTRPADPMYTWCHCPWTVLWCHWLPGDILDT